jgi:hypothetical protein
MKTRSATAHNSNMEKKIEYDKSASWHRPV